MVESAMYWLTMFGRVVIGAIVFAIVWYFVVVYGLQDWLAYRRAKKEIFVFVELYKYRCTGNNRFIVTVATLQDSFREYDTKIIERVWQDLVDTRKIVSDPQDSEWCVR